MELSRLIFAGMMLGELVHTSFLWANKNLQWWGPNIRKLNTVAAKIPW